MLVLRSITFNVLFYLTLALLMIGGLPTIAGGRKSVHRVTRAWSTLSLKLLKHVCGVDIEFRGIENIPPGGCIVASKHQSALETFALTQGLKPHPQELELKEIAAETDSPQNRYKRGECYPYDEENQE